MSSFNTKKLDTLEGWANTLDMDIATTTDGPTRIAALVRQRIERGGERVWRLEDFRELAFYAVAQILSRLTVKGQ
jgi:hypothetical protein